MTSSFRPGPLFHSRVHPEPIASFAFPDDLDRRHAVLLGFVDALKRGRLDDTKEGSLHGDFLRRIFGDALGYRSVTRGGDEGWELATEQRTGTGGKSVGGALGFFRQGEPDRVLVPIELRSIRQHLDRSGGRAPTPVQRAWDYANHSPGCRFLIVSNYEETRLYSTARTPDVCETFMLEDLATIDGFKRFYYLLARERLLGPAPGVASPVELLLASSARAEAEVTRELYDEYRGLREKLFAELRLAHSNLPALEVLGYAQALLDRVLFVAFAEARGMLPENTLAGAMARGFQEDTEPLRLTPRLEHLEISEERCAELASLARYGSRDEVSVEVLGYVFEQSIGDLEALRRRAAGAGSRASEPSKRHDEGAHYTPAHLTRYLVDRTLRRTLTERREAIFDRITLPREEQTAALIAAWGAYREELSGIRVLDPACGAGAFLVAAYDVLGREYQRVDGELADLRGGRVEPFDPGGMVLDNNLFGVDLDPESIEITKRSLWLKAAQRGRRSTSLDGKVRWGDSIVSDPRLTRAAFDWARACWYEGFDVVIGNPPYIRHELFTHVKDHLSQSYAAYHGMADIYVYFFERGLSVLKPQGRLGFIVSNKWLRAGYAAPLRRLLATRTEIESLVDFGHAPLFEDADTFPCVVALRKLAEGEEVAKNHMLSVTAFPRSELEKIEIAEYVASHQYTVPQRRLSEEAWSLEPEAAEALYQKIRGRGTPLAELSGGKPRRGFLTGYNEAFMVDDATRRQLIEEDPRSAQIIKKCLRGQDVDRWSPSWNGTFLICARHGIDIDAYPAIKRHLSRFRRELEPRPRDHRGHDWPGRKPGPYQWYELQDATEYWDLFAKPKIVYQEIQFHPAYGLDEEGLLVNNKTFFLCKNDPWLLAVLNSPLMWWHNWRYLGHMKDEALSPAGVKMEQLPIAPPDDAARAVAEDCVPQLVAFMKEDQEARSGVLDALDTQMNVAAPGHKLQAFETLSRDGFIAEVTKRRPKTGGKLGPADVKYLRDVYDAYAVPIQGRRSRARAMERRLADLVDRAYGLTTDDVELLWSTAPPRMPVGR